MCRPHAWIEPQPGDTALTCGACGLVLDRERDITQNMRASIVNSVEARRGPDPADRFRAFFGYGPLAL